MSKSKDNDNLVRQTNELLDKDYGFTFFSGDFYVIDRYNENKYLSKNLFIRQARTILSVDEKYISEWFNAKKDIVTEKLLDYLSKVDKNERGSIQLAIKMKSYFANDELINDDMVTSFLESFYVTNILDNIIKEQTDELDPKRIDLEYFVDIKAALEKTELKNIYELAKTKLNDWYYKAMIGDKVDDLFSQFVITLGKADWKVTWIGHGPVTEEKIAKYFRVDMDKYSEYILDKYQEWFDNAVIDASEREMKNERNFELFNKIQRGILKLNTKEIDDSDI